MADSYSDYLLSKGLSRSTITGYYCYLLHFINWCEEQQTEPEQLSHNHLIQYIDHLKTKPKSLHQKSVKQYLLAISHYYQWLSTTQGTNYNPIQSLRFKVTHQKKLYTILDAHQLDALYHLYPIDEAYLHTSKRNKAITGLMVYQGLDITTLELLTVDHLKLREGKIYIPSTRKSNERILTLEAAQIMDMMEYTHQIRPELLEQNTTENNLLIVSTGGSPKLHNTLAPLMKKLRKIEPQLTNAKQIRASVITRWLKQYDLRETQYRAGHRYISSTEAYQQNDVTELQISIDTIHPLN